MRPRYERGQFPAPTGHCATCRWLDSQFRPVLDWKGLWEEEPSEWPVRFFCRIDAHWHVPHAHNCKRYEREPGSD